VIGYYLHDFLRAHSGFVHLASLHSIKFMFYCNCDRILLYNKSCMQYVLCFIVVVVGV